jgi:hypothetical protein
MDSGYLHKNMRRMRDPHTARGEIRPTTLPKLDLNNLKAKMGYRNLRESLPNIKL